MTIQTMSETPELVVSKPILAIDARPLSRGTGGIQRYLERILPHLIESNLFEIVLYTDKALSPTHSRNFAELKTRKISNGYLSQIAWFFVVPYWVYIDRPNIFWSPRHQLPVFLPKAIRAIVTVHDLVWKTMPSTMPFIQRWSEIILTPYALLRADQILCVSRTTANALQNYFPKTKSKTQIILHGQDKRTNVGKPRKSPAKHQILAVGTLEPRKNYIRLIDAFEHYVNNGGKMNLHIVGKKGWKFQDILKKLECSSANNRIRISESLSDRELESEYSNSECLVSISLDEGFGLPIVESQDFELPLLLSEIPIYRELFPKTKYWADPHSSEDISNKLSDIERSLSGKQNLNGTVDSFNDWRDCAASHIRYISLQPQCSGSSSKKSK